MLIDFVTVVYDDEVYLLEWQAKSLRKFIEQDNINKIIIVDNGSQQCDKVIKLDWYGHLKDKVKIINHQHLNLETYTYLDGWRTQQLCKLLASSQSKTEWCCVLDAKTFFSKKINFQILFTNNKPCVGTVPVSIWWSDSKKFLETFYHINLNKIIGPGGVPFFFHTETVKQLVNSIPKFNNWFQDLLYETTPPHRLLITEFMLYSAFVIKKYGTFDILYNKESRLQAFNLAEWQLKADINEFYKIFNGKHDTISIAEKSKKYLDNKKIKEWNNFLNEQYN